MGVYGGGSGGSRVGARSLEVALEFCVPHPAREWQSQELNTALLIVEPAPLT